MILKHTSTLNCLLALDLTRTCIFTLALCFYLLDPVARAIALELALDVVSGIQPIQNLNILKAIEELTNADEKTAWGAFPDTYIAHLNRKTLSIYVNGYKILITVMLL